MTKESILLFKHKKYNKIFSSFKINFKSLTNIYIIGRITNEKNNKAIHFKLFTVLEAD